MQVSKSAPLATKEVDDVLGGKDAWKNVDQTTGAGCIPGGCPSRPALRGSALRCTCLFPIWCSDMPCVLE